MADQSLSDRISNAKKEVSVVVVCIRVFVLSPAARDDGVCVGTLSWKKKIKKKIFFCFFGGGEPPSLFAAVAATFVKIFPRRSMVFIPQLFRLVVFFHFSNVSLFPLSTQELFLQFFCAPLVAQQTFDFIFYLILIKKKIHIQCHFSRWCLLRRSIETAASVFIILFYTDDACVFYVAEFVRVLNCDAW